jgi:hypothetical protein
MKIERCALCGTIIDPDDDFNEKTDDAELCGMCNLVSAGRVS